jgi:hypothetical protein
MDKKENFKFKPDFKVNNFMPKYPVEYPINEIIFENEEVERNFDDENEKEKKATLRKNEMEVIFDEMEKIISKKRTTRLP